MLETGEFAAAQQNLIRNRGTSDLWFTQNQSLNSDQDRNSDRNRFNNRSLRIRPDGLDILNRNQKSVSLAELAGFLDIKDTDQCRRKSRLHTEEAWLNAENAKIQKDKWFDFENNLKNNDNIFVNKSIKNQFNQDTGQNNNNNNFQKVNWFEHVPFQAAPIHSGQTKSIRTTAEQNDWFEHKSFTDMADTVCEYKQRVKYEGVENALRNRGTDDLLCMKSNNVQNDLNCVRYGCPSENAQQNANLSINGTGMAQCMGANSTNSSIDRDNDVCKKYCIRPQSAAVRGSEAEEWRLRGRNGCMGNLMFTGTNQARPNDSCLILSAGKENQLKSINGHGIMQCLNLTQKSPASENETSARENYRLRTTEAKQIMKRNQGEMMYYLGNKAHSVNHRYPKKLQIRSTKTSEARKAASFNKGKELKDLISNYKLTPKHYSSSKFENMSSEGKALAEMNRSGKIAGLLGNSSKLSDISLVGIEAPAPKRLHYEAVEYANLHKGQEMSDLLKQAS